MRFVESTIVFLTWSALTLLAVSSGEPEASKSGFFTTACVHSTTGYCDNPYSGAFSFENDDGRVMENVVNGSSPELLLCHNATTPAKMTSPEYGKLFTRMAIADFSHSKTKCVKYTFDMHSDFDPDSLIVYFELGNGERVFLESGSACCQRQNCCRNEAVPKCLLRTVSQTRVVDGRVKAVIEFLPKLEPGKLCVYQLTVNKSCRP